MMLRAIRFTCGATTIAAVLTTAAPAASGGAAQTAVDHRGDTVMGFSHQKSAHHFRLAPDGGRIEVTATAATDATTIAAIRSHLKEVAGRFSRGEFGQPRAIHDRELPGIAVMRAQREAITYGFEEMPQGGRVTIATKDAAVTTAIHEFLRAQIADHRTGDPTTAEPSTHQPAPGHRHH